MTKLTGRNVRPITRADFPFNTPVIVEAFIDREAGWEFDAPMHIMVPWHRYCIINSITSHVLFDRIDNILTDLDCGFSVEADDDSWPYSPGYLKRKWRQIRSGKCAKRFPVLSATVTVFEWASNDESCGQWDIKSEWVHYDEKENP